MKGERFWAVSSGGESTADIAGVTGSSPVSPTMSPIRVTSKLVLQSLPLQPWAESGVAAGPAKGNEMKLGVKMEREDEDHEIWLLLDRTQRLIHQSSSKEFRRFGISPIEASVLSVIRDIAPSEVIPAEISRRVFRRPRSVLELLKRMEKKGLVETAHNLDDKRLVGVTMTEKGQRAYYMSTQGESIHGIMASLSGEKRQQLRSCLQTLQDRVKELEEESREAAKVKGGYKT